MPNLQNLDGSGPWFMAWYLPHLATTKKIKKSMGISSHRPYTSLIYGRYLQLRFLKWPLKKSLLGHVYSIWWVSPNWSDWAGVLLLTLQEVQPQTKAGAWGAAANEEQRLLWSFMLWTQFSFWLVWWWKPPKKQMTAHHRCSWFLHLCVVALFTL